MSVTQPARSDFGLTPRFPRTWGPESFGPPTFPAPNTSRRTSRTGGPPSLGMGWSPTHLPSRNGRGGGGRIKRGSTRSHCVRAGSAAAPPTARHWSDGADDGLRTSGSTLGRIRMLLYSPSSMVTTSAKSTVGTTNVLRARQMLQRPLRRATFHVSFFPAANRFRHFAPTGVVYWTSRQRVKNAGNS